MYIALILILLAVAAAVVYRGMQQQKKGTMTLGFLIAAATLALFQFLDFWGEALWFMSLGYGDRFWVAVLAQAGFAAVGALVGIGLVYLLTVRIPKATIAAKYWPETLAGVIGGLWGLANWQPALEYFYRVSTELKDPVLGNDTGFYLFALPFYDAVFGLLVLLTAIAFLAALAARFVRIDRERYDFHLAASDDSTGGGQNQALFFSAAAVVLVLAWGKVLNIYHTMYSTWGAVNGPGWTDVNIRIPGYWIAAIFTALIGVALLIRPARDWAAKKVSRSQMQTRQSSAASAVLFIAAGAIAAVWFVALTAIPGLLQWLRVEPNEITFEKPYIKNNIQFTRHGFNLHTAEEREFPVSEEFTAETVAQNDQILSNIRLWDWRALDAVYQQFQEIRLYYEFTDVDIDRYTIDDDYRQVMVSAREMSLNNLPSQSQTFVNKRFKYTHGYGLTLTTVNDFTENGLPNLLIKDLPPQAKFAELAVERPEIYYGELTDTHVVVNSSEKEFDYPRGDENVYANYAGKGGVELSGLWRKFLYGWKFDGTQLFLSGYPKADSRIMFHRQIEERVRALAPFLQFEDDPYIVLAEGKLYWIVDAYTSSGYFPYSEPFSSSEVIGYEQSGYERAVANYTAHHLDGANYVRNSVKAVVDAYSGAVDFYIFDGDDPIIRVWQQIFPDLFKMRADMPEALQQHVRYPQGMLLAQGIVYAKYHMNDPAVFYNQEDLWVRATEKYYNSVQPVEPYYVMWELPESDQQEFVLMLPFTPKNRQVLIGWIAGMCDAENYGRFLAFKFPKEKRILGPQQVETKIDQDSFLSGQLSLWDQRGSNVIRGNVLAIPIGETLIYVEPIYLQAETAAYPELRLVAVMHNDNLSYAETFDEALRGLLKDASEKMTTREQLRAPIDMTITELIRQANEAFERYLRLTGEKRYAEAAEALEALQQTLQKLTAQQNTEATDTD